MTPAWDIGTAYAALDQVTYAGHLWSALQSGTGHQPDTSPMWWSDLGIALTITAAVSSGYVHLSGTKGPGSTVDAYRRP